MNVESTNGTFNEKFKKILSENALAGGISSLLSCVLLQPLDLIKTRQQQQLSSCSDKPVASRSVVRISKEIVHEKGIRGLWRGTMPSVFRVVPGGVLYFGMLNTMRSYVQPDMDKNRLIHENLLTGGIARAITTISLLPISVVKVRYESNLYRYGNVLGALRDIRKYEGVKSLYSGMIPTVLRDSSYAGIYFALYEKFKSHTRLINMREDNRSSFYEHFLCGLSAGLLSTIITHPPDVIKTRMQLDPYKHVNVVKSIYWIFKEEKFKGFYRGFVPRCLRKTMSAAFTWTLYEEVIRWIQRP